MNDQVIDCIGVPEFYADHLGETEDAGNGLVRCVRCVKRRGVVIPVYSVIVPAIMIVQESSGLREIANKVMRIAMTNGSAH